MVDGAGERWLAADIAFKPYACGTMAHPYIDCAKKLVAAGLRPEQIAAIECETAEGIVHRLWEPLAAKQQPPNGYAAKFSIPYAIAVGMLRGDAGLLDYEEAVVHDPAVRALAAKVRYVIDPANPYPNQFTGHVRVTLRNGEVREARQGHFRGGVLEPLSAADLEAKFRANCVYGGWSADRACQFRARCARCAPRRGSSSTCCGARHMLVTATAQQSRHRHRRRTQYRARHRAGARERGGEGGGQRARAATKAKRWWTRSRRAVARPCWSSPTSRGASKWNAMIAAIAKRFGRLDIVVNNAAIRHEVAFADLPYADWRAAQAVCVDGAFHCTQAALPLLQKSETGTVIQIGGMTAQTGAARRTHVVTAKAALGGFTRALAHELAEFGITVNCISPGMIETVRKDASATARPEHHAKHQPLLKRRGHPDEIASAVVWLAGAGGRFTTGQTLHINGGTYLGG